MLETYAHADHLSAVSYIKQRTGAQVAIGEHIREVQTIFRPIFNKAPGRDAYAWESTVAEARARNVHIHDGVSETDFVTMRQRRDKTLAAPTLLLPSVQVNIRAGQLPKAESNGVTYLKIPVRLTE